MANPNLWPFPKPEEASIQIDGVRVVTLAKSIELKLASGMTAPHRLRDLADVHDLIKVRGLGSEFARELDPYVRNRYLELWDAIDRAGINEQPDSNISAEE